MADTKWNAVNDTIKGIAGIGGIQAVESVQNLGLDDISLLIAHVAQGIIATLTIASLIKSLFFTKKQ